MNDEAFFDDHPVARPIYRAVKAAVAAVGAAEVRVSKSQVGFYRNHPFAAVWKPGQYLAGEHPPLVLTVFLRDRDPSPRWKEVAEPGHGRFAHHFELPSPDEVDDEVRARLREAWNQAG